MTAQHGVPTPDDHVIVIFGATGDLAKRKLLPGLFHLANAGLLPTKYRIVGSAPAHGTRRPTTSSANTPSMPSTSSG